MSGRYELTDFARSVVEPLLPNEPRGVPRADDRWVLNGIFWVLHTGRYRTPKVQEVIARVVLISDAEGVARMVDNIFVTSTASK